MNLICSLPERRRTEKNSRLLWQIYWRNLIKILLPVGISDEDMMKPWSLLSGGQVIFTQPRAGVFRGMILNHLIHHRAQLSVYLRMNDVPVPALYGPSADEGI